MCSSDWLLERQIDTLETLLLILEMHPMFTRQTFTLLRHNLRAMNTSRLHPDVAELMEYFASLPDDQLRAAWNALHNPQRLQYRTLH